MFHTPGGDLLVLDGTDFGPVAANNSVTVHLDNFELRKGGRFTGMGSIAAMHYRLLDCSVTVAHVRVECTLPPKMDRVFHDSDISRFAPTAAGALSCTELAYL